MVTDFHKAPKAWTQLKHAILRNYLAPFLGKLGSGDKCVFYVDGFAGPGRLDDGSKGSPLKAADEAANPPAASRRGILRCINVEADPEVFANLEQATEAYVRQGLVQNLQGDFAAQLPAVLEKTGNHPAFFFIDPFGTQGAEIDTLDRINRRRGKTEVLVRYDDTRVKRLISWAAHNADHWDASKRKTALALKARVDQLTDEQAAAQVESVLASESGEETREWLTAGYALRVRATAGFRFSLAYPIRNPQTRGHRYYLIHFCNYPDGYIYMANAMAKVERALQRAQSGEPDLFAPPQLEFEAITRELDEQDKEARVRNLVEQIPEIVRQHRWNSRRIQNREVFAAIVDRFNWTVLLSEYVKALRQLEKDGRLRLEGAKEGDYATFGDI